MLFILDDVPLGNDSVRIFHTGAFASLFEGGFREKSTAQFSEILISVFRNFHSWYMVFLRNWTTSRPFRLLLIRGKITCFALGPTDFLLAK